MLVYELELVELRAKWDPEMEKRLAPMANEPND